MRTILFSSLMKPDTHTHLAREKEAKADKHQVTKQAGVINIIYRVLPHHPVVRVCESVVCPQGS